MFPPFEPGSVWISDRGRLWIRRSLPEDHRTTLHVIGRDGRLAAVGTLPPGRLLVGVGEVSLYATAADELGLLTLERYPMPGKP